MRLRFRQLKWDGITLPQVFVCSMVSVMAGLLINKSDLLIQTSWMDASSLEAIKSQLTGSKELFVYILKERVSLVLALFLLSTTYLGNMFTYLHVIWFGACSGMFLTIVMLRYGLKGILILFSGIFPHYFIYVPAMILTISLMREKRIPDRKFFGQLFVVLLVVIIGCILECYVNPYILVKTIKNLRL